MHDLSLTTRILIQPLRRGLVAGADNTVDVLVRVQAPDLPAGNLPPRPPCAIALVIDRSGSMSGRPLAEARRCASYVADALGPEDVVSLVQFDHEVELLAPAARRGDARALHAAIESIEARGNTARCTPAGAPAPRASPVSGSRSRA